MPFAGTWWCVIPVWCTCVEQHAVASLEVDATNGLPAPTDLDLDSYLATLMVSDVRSFKAMGGAHADLAALLAMSIAKQYDDLWKPLVVRACMRLPPFAPCCVRASQNYLETGLSGLRCSIALRHRAMLGCVRNNSVHVLLGPACMRSWAAYEHEF